MNELNKSKRSSLTEVGKFEFGKILPQSVELEEVVLGSLLLEPNAILSIINYYSPDIFYLEAHKHIFSAILELFRKSDPIDMLTVTRKLKEMDKLELAGGAYYISQLTRRIASASNIDYHARIVFQDYIRRKAIEYSHNITMKAYDVGVDIFDLIKIFEENHIELSNFIDRPDVNPTDMVNQFVDNVASQKPPTSSLFVNRSVGIPKLDKIVRWSPNKLLLLAGNAKGGKCFDGKTEFILFDGSIVKAKDVKVGDVLMGADNSPKNVTSINTGYQMMYRVSQSNGITYVVNEDHILSLITSYSTKANDKKGDIHNICLKDYLNSTKEYKRYHKGYKTAIEWPKQDTFVDPYYLGLWLGDGNNVDSGICNPDIEIIEWINDYANSIGFKVSVYDKNRCPVHHLIGNKGMKTVLRKNLLQHNKHIPKEFLINSKENRLKLLAGLIDTDGYRRVKLSGSDAYEIIQKSDRLASDIQFLAHSLGFATKLTRKEGKINGVLKGIYNKITIKGDCSIIPCKVKRKQIHNSPKRNNIYSNLKIEPIGVGKYYGLTLDTDDNRFLLKDFTVVHNTKLVSHIIWQLLRNDKQTSVLWVTLEDTASDLLAAFCGPKVLVKPKNILERKTTNEERMAIVQCTEEWKTFDIEFVEESISIAQIKTKALVFTKNRPGRFIIIVIDNLLSLQDKYNFSRNMVQFYDYVIGVVADIRRSTNAFIFLLHHMNDEYSDESNIDAGFRPHLTHIKGSEATRRVPNYTLMMNTTVSHKTLLNQYTGEKRYILERMTILDPGTIRDEANVGDDALIRLYSNLDFNYFEEI